MNFIKSLTPDHKNTIKKVFAMTFSVLLLISVFTMHAEAAETSSAQESSKASETATPETTTAHIPVTGITMDQGSAILKACKSLDLKASVLPKDASNKKINFETSDPKIAEVSEDGKVSGRGYGTATITATTEDGGFSTSCEIKVQFFDLEDDSESIYTPIYWAVEEDVVSPASRTTFLPRSICTREAAVDYIYKLMEKPDFSKGTTFKDVKKDSPYYEAISWAQEKGLLKDITDKELFAGGKSCLKEEMATLLYRASDSPYVGYDGLFMDAPDDSYYKDAINWAVENNVMDGYRDEDGSSSYIFGSGDRLTKEDAAIFLYNYTHEKNPGFAEGFFAENMFPTLMVGMEVPEDLYNKYTDPQYCAEVFAYYALQDGWQYEAVVGALAYMYAEGLGAKGTFTYEGCWAVTGPSGNVQDRTLNNAAWREWTHSDNCRIQMISHSSYYSNTHYAIGLGYCGESNVWNVSGGRWKQIVNNCDSLLNAADLSGVAWQDINFQTKRAMATIRSCTYDPDWRDPTTFAGDAREYCARVFATVGYTGFPVWYDNGQLGAHLDKVETVRPFVDAVINHTSQIEADLVPNNILY